MKKEDLLKNFLKVCGSDGDNGDSTDMNVWGYFKDKAGRIYTETTYNYMDYEFYREQFEGNQSS